MEKWWFKAHFRWETALNCLSDEDAGKLARGIFAYASRGEEVQLDGMAYIAFQMIKSDIDDDGARGAEISRKRAEAGRIGGQAKKAEKQTETPTEPTETDKDGSTQAEPETPQKGKQTVKKRKPRTPFVIPTEEEVAAYIREKNYHISAQEFVAFYDSKHWKIGINPMTDWKAACRTWEYRNQRNGQEPAQAQRSQKPKVMQESDFDQREYKEHEAGYVPEWMR